MKMYTGKYKGQELKDIPRDYLLWFSINAFVRLEYVEELVRILGDSIPDKIMNMMPIEYKVEKHKQRYPTFDDIGFLEWYNHYKKYLKS